MPACFNQAEGRSEIDRAAEAVTRAKSGTRQDLKANSAGLLDSARSHGMTEMFSALASPRL